VILKAKSPATNIKKDKAKASSNLNVEQKLDDDAAKDSTVEVAPKKQTPKPKGVSPAKKIKLGPTKAQLPSPAGKKGKRDRDMESESSGTLSSPPPR
jgi:hypothetical protein